MLKSLLVRRINLASPLRCLSTLSSSSKLFIGGLSYDTNEPVLKNECEKYGKVLDVRVICDRMSGKSKGYGFVLFDSEEAAASALASMNNQLLEGRNIRVEYAQPQPQPKPGLRYDNNEPVLKNECESTGKVVDDADRMICDRMSGKSKVYCSVLFDSEEAAAATALASMNKQLFEGT